jgi:hypothetical protein
MAQRILRQAPLVQDVSSFRRGLPDLHIGDESSKFF